MSPTAAAARSQRSPRRQASGARWPRLSLHSQSTGRTRRPELLAALIVVVALMAVIIGHAMLTQGQLRLGSLGSELTAERSKHSQTVLKVAALETPSRISSEASSMQLVQPKVVLQLPMVPLDQPLAPIQIVGQATQGAGR